MKKILVTGGAGFIGSNLCERLLNEGNTVICMDNLYSSSEKNISHLLDNKNFTFIKQSVEKPIDIDVDEIYNLACPASPVWYQKNPINTTMTSVLGAYNMLELATKKGARILQASTSEVYGDPFINIQDETYWGNVNPIGIRSCYDEGKRCAESLFFDYHRTYGTDIRVIRIFNTYGERMSPDDGRVVSNFIVQALQGKDITIYGDGMQTRSFQYVTDLIEGMLLMMKSTFIGPVNIGNPEEFTIRQLTEEVIRLTGSKSKIIYEKLPSDDPKRRKPDISRAKDFLGYKPTVSLEEGLSKTIKYFKTII